MYRRKVINVDLQKVFVRPLHEDVSVHLDKELYDPTGILDVPPFNLSIDIILKKKLKKTVKYVADFWKIHKIHLIF